MDQDFDSLLRQYRKKKLFDPATLPYQFSYGTAEVESIIPHRKPLLYVDGLTGWDPERGCIAGYRSISPDDPVFQGHFPEYPVYPGNFMVESIGQLGLCMYHFVAHQTNHILPDAKPVALRATKITGALFVEPVLPGARVTLLARKITWDGYFATMIGQAIVNDKVAVVCGGEVMILQD